MITLPLSPEQIRKEVENVDRKVVMALKGNGMIATKRGSFSVSDESRLSIYLEGRNTRAVYAGCEQVTIDDYKRMAGVKEEVSGYLPLTIYQRES